MTERVQVSGLQVARSIYDLVKQDIIPGTGVNMDAFWQSFASIIADLAPKNRELLAKRDHLQTQIDQWHQERAGQNVNQAEYKAFLQDIGYLVSEGDDFAITTSNVDPEITSQAGPQTGGASYECPICT